MTGPWAGSGLQARGCRAGPGLGGLQCGSAHPRIPISGAAARAVCVKSYASQNCIRTRSLQERSKGKVLELQASHPALALGAQLAMLRVQAAQGWAGGEVRAPAWRPSVLQLMANFFNHAAPLAGELYS